MATIPLSGTDIRFLAGVPFYADYKETRYFSTVGEKRAWFESRTEVHRMQEASFQRKDGVNIVRVNMHIDKLWNVNYMTFTNNGYSNRIFYCFVTWLEYVNDGNTNVHFVTDVFQTWWHDVKFQPSYIVREHVDRWDANGDPIRHTVDEGLDYGSEYEIRDVQKWVPYDDLQFLVIVSKSLLHGTDANKIKASKNGAPQPLSYYIHPFRLDGTVPKVVMKDTGGSWGISPIIDLLSNIFRQDDAVGNIVAMYVTDHAGTIPEYDGETLTISGNAFDTAGITDEAEGNENVNTLYCASLPEYFNSEKNFGYKYEEFANVSESKLLMYPYALTELTDFKGNHVTLKNEYIDDRDLHIKVYGSMGVSNKVAYLPLYYNVAGNYGAWEEITALEHALINNNPNDVSIINDYLASYLQGNRNSLENQKAQIIFNGLMNTVGNLVGGISSAEPNPKTGGINGAGVASSALSATSSAGNTLLDIQAMEAKKQDIANTPPTLAKMGSNTAFDYGHDIRGLYVIKKQITPEYRDKLTDFFKKYGYKSGRVKKPNLKTREHYNYVQTKDAIIVASGSVGMANNDLLELRRIFDNGITLWHTDDIGNYSLANNELR